RSAGGAVHSAGRPTGDRRHVRAASAAGSLDVPSSPEHLDELVDRALSSVIRGPVVRDGDGDVPLVGDHGTAYVRVKRDEPVVEVFALLQRLDEDEPPARAVWVANARNARSSLLTFVVMHGCLVVRAALWAHPFVPAVLLR